MVVNEISLGGLRAILGETDECYLFAAVDGGRNLYVPDRVGKNHPISKILGYEGAQTLAQAVGGGWVFIERPRDWRRLVRVWRCRRLLLGGYSVASIAEIMEISTTTVYSYRNECRIKGWLA